jgi:hypothetical protein
VADVELEMKMPEGFFESGDSRDGFDFITNGIFSKTAILSKVCLATFAFALKKLRPASGKARNNCERWCP